MTEERKLCNLLIKTFLVLINLLLWIFGGLLIAIGIIAELQSEDYGSVSSSVLRTPAIVCIVLGSLLFVLGVLGTIGALVEFFPLLLIYVLLLTLILLSEIGIGIFVFLRSDETEEIVQEQLNELIVNYREDPDLQNLIDALQADLLECCGINGPDDWQRNPYFNCTSPSLQRCSVPFSCCLPEENSNVVNTQCGDGALRSDRVAQRETTIYTNGCYGEFEDLINSLLPILGGVVVGIIAFEILSIVLTLGLALDIRNEKKLAKKWRQEHPEPSKKRTKSPKGQNAVSDIRMTNLAK